MSDIYIEFSAILNSYQQIPNLESWKESRERSFLALSLHCLPCYGVKSVKLVRKCPPLLVIMGTLVVTLTNISKVAIKEEAISNVLFVTRQSLLI